MGQSEPIVVLDYRSSPTPGPSAVGSLLLWLLVLQCVVVLVASAWCAGVSLSKGALYLGRPFIHSAPVEAYPMWAFGLLGFGAWMEARCDPSFRRTNSQSVGAVLSVCLVMTMSAPLLMALHGSPSDPWLVVVDLAGAVGSVVSQSVVFAMVLRRYGAKIVGWHSAACVLFVVWCGAFRMLDYVYIVAGGDMPSAGYYVMYVRAFGGEHERSYLLWQYGRMGVIVLAGLVIASLVRLNSSRNRGADQV